MLLFIHANLFFIWWTRTGGELIISSKVEYFPFWKRHRVHNHMTWTLPWGEIKHLPNPCYRHTAWTEEDSGEFARMTLHSGQWLLGLPPSVTPSISNDRIMCLRKREGENIDSWVSWTVVVIWGRNVLYSLGGLSPWSSTGYYVWDGLGVISLLEKVHHWRVGFFK